MKQIVRVICSLALLVNSALADIGLDLPDEKLKAAICTKVAEQIDPSEFSCNRLKITGPQISDYLWLTVSDEDVDKLVASMLLENRVAEHASEEYKSYLKGKLAYSVFDYDNDGSAETIYRIPDSTDEDCKQFSSGFAYRYHIVDVPSGRIISEAQYDRFRNYMTPLVYKNMNMVYITALSKAGISTEVLIPKRFGGNSKLYYFTLCRLRIPYPDT